MLTITRVSVAIVDTPSVSPSFRWRNGLPGSEGRHRGGWLVIETSDGVTGFAYCRRGDILADVVERRIHAELKGQNPLRREWLWRRMWELDRIEEFPIYIQGVVDDALWDIAGKVAGLPVHELIGSFRASIPAYASTVVFDSVEEYLDVADQCIELGFGAIKLHAWGDVARDADLAVRLRAHVGDDLPLMYDGSAGFDLGQATSLGRVLADAGFLWYEEPMREFSVRAYQLLASRVDVPLLVAETSDGAHMNTGDFIAAGAADSVRTGSYFRGGITGALRIAHLADSYLMRAEVHGGGLANTHLCMAIPNTTYYEALIDSPTVARPSEVDEHGLVHAPSGPGLGHEQQWSMTGVPAGLERISEG